MLLLFSPRVAYYHSAGTTSEGMHLGASPYLITEVAARLRVRGLEFNLGGAEPENAGLYRFKSELGLPFGRLRRPVSSAWARSGASSGRLRVA